VAVCATPPFDHPHGFHRRPAMKCDHLSPNALLCTDRAGLAPAKPGAECVLNDRLLIDPWLVSRTIFVACAGIGD